MEEAQTLGEIILEDERVKLSPLTADNYENLLPFALNEPEIWHFSLVRAAGADGFENYMQIALDNKAKGIEYPFIVFDKLHNEYAGSTRFYDINLPWKTLQLGYTWYGKKFQRTGLNRHCKYLLFDYSFDVLGLERMELRADNDNARSITAMKAIGCKVDGILRNNMPRPDGGRRNSIILSVLRDEWYGEVKERLKGLIK